MVGMVILIVIAVAVMSVLTSPKLLGPDQLVKDMEVYHGAR